MRYTYDSLLRELSYAQRATLDAFDKMQDAHMVQEAVTPAERAHLQLEEHGAVRAVVSHVKNVLTAILKREDALRVDLEGQNVKVPPVRASALPPELGEGARHG